MVDAVTSAIPSVRTLSTERVAVSFGDSALTTTSASAFRPNIIP